MKEIKEATSLKTFVALADVNCTKDKILLQYFKNQNSDLKKASQQFFLCA